MIACSRPECQTTAGCICTLPMPITVYLYATTNIRWNHNILEQMFINSKTGQTYWRRIPGVFEGKGASYEHLVG